MTYMSFGDKLKKIRVDRNMSQEELGELLGTSKQVISRYETNQRTPKITVVEDYAKKLNVPLEYLINNSVLDIKDISSDSIEKPSNSNSSIVNEEVPVVNLPIVGRVSCGNGSLAYEDIEGYEPTPKSWLNGGEYFYSRVIGDSMINARIQHGDLALIRKQPDVENGEIAAVTIGDMNDDKVYLKRVYKKNGTIVLQSENPAFSPIIYDPKKSDCRIVGKLKRIVITM
ncbi:LexA family protein [Anaerospora hongkongensis]|uniref:LexA family protein n=1 Tax=Anaerospora hongkongensis TaxID=244830 RepID=UPI0028A169C7|nr:XRE family transcriptional regulator [Anaerospora hongkongensis]